MSQCTIIVLYCHNSLVSSSDFRQWTQFFAQPSYMPTSNQEECDGGWSIVLSPSYPQIQTANSDLKRLLRQILICQTPHPRGPSGTAWAEHKHVSYTHTHTHIHSVSVIHYTRAHTHTHTVTVESVQLQTHCVDHYCYWRHIMSSRSLFWRSGLIPTEWKCLIRFSPIRFSIKIPCTYNRHQEHIISWYHNSMTVSLLTFVSSYWLRIQFFAQEDKQYMFFLPLPSNPQPTVTWKGCCALPDASPQGAKLHWW